ncbi:MAG: hypothetical protein J6N52_11830 [Clostridia bacterium]|nr:hypothetical protein [Clostridia bacterium]
MKLKKIIAGIQIAAICLSMWSFPANAVDECFETGSYISFGKLNGEALIWKAAGADSNGYLLLSEKIVGAGAFNASSDTVRDDLYRQTHGSNFWGNSSLHDWLNSDEEVVTYTGAVPDANHILNGRNNYENKPGFLYEFSDAEKNHISLSENKAVLSYLDCGSSTGGNEVYSGGRDISEIGSFENAFYKTFKEKVFVPDRMVIYNELLRDGLKLKELTASALLNTAPESMPVNKFWTKTPQGDNTSNVYVCETDGREFYMSPYNAYNSDVGIVPALYVADAKVKSGAGTMENPYILDVYGGTGDFYEDIAFVCELTDIALRTKQQPDIDKAQIAAARLETCSEKTECEKKLDALQDSLDVALKVDFSDRYEGEAQRFSDYTNGSIISENGNKTAKIELTETRSEGWGPRYDIGSVLPEEFRIEQKVKYAGNINSGRIYLYAQDGNCYLYNIFFDEGKVINSSWSDSSPNGAMLPDKWYNIVYAVKGGTYRISVADAENNTVIYESPDYDFKYDSSGFTKLQYTVEGSTPDNTGCYYLDDLIVYAKNPEAQARDAVVAAERSRLESDKDKAMNMVLGINGPEKENLTERLNKIGKFNAAVNYNDCEDGIEVVSEIISGEDNSGYVQMITAVYQDNHLYSCAVSPKRRILFAGRIAETVKKPPAGNYEIRVFFWNGVSEMKPYIKGAVN